MSRQPHGLINQSALGRKDDSLFRLSLKAFIRNEKGEVLVVKEDGRTWWDLPGGGMDHGESIEQALARELLEEVSLRGAFTYDVIAVDEPLLLEHANVWQMRVIFHVVPTDRRFMPGDDGDEIAFIDPSTLRDSDHDGERSVFRYARLSSD